MTLRINMKQRGHRNRQIEEDKHSHTYKHSKPTLSSARHVNALSNTTRGVSGWPSVVNAYTGALYTAHSKALLMLSYMIAVSKQSPMHWMSGHANTNAQ